MKRYSITVNGNTYDVIVEEADASGIVSTPVAAPVSAPAPAAAPAAPKPAAPKAAAPQGTAGANKVTAPMPGTILNIKVSAGQSVDRKSVV